MQKERRKHHFVWGMYREVLLVLFSKNDWNLNTLLSLLFKHCKLTLCWLTSTSCAEQGLLGGGVGDKAPVRSDDVTEHRNKPCEAPGPEMKMF